jgi:hypothetical protein
MIFFLKILLHDKNVICVNKYMSEYNISDTNCLSENSLSKIEQDLKWMENIKKYINENEENKERRKKAIMFFDTYRIPASIVYRIFRNLRELNVDINKIYKKYESYIKNIRITNGLRSIKLICFRFYLDLRLKKKSRKEIQ